MVHPSWHSCSTRAQSDCIHISPSWMARCRAGLYKMPWDMTTLRHRQTNPLFVLRKVRACLRLDAFLVDSLVQIVAFPQHHKSSCSLSAALRIKLQQSHWICLPTLEATLVKRRQYLCGRQLTPSAGATARRTLACGWTRACTQTTTDRPSTTRCASEVLQYACQMPASSTRYLPYGDNGYKLQVKTELVIVCAFLLPQTDGWMSKESAGVL